MKALLIVGSPKGKAGTSYALGSALTRRLAVLGLEAEELTVAESLRSTEGQHRLHKAIDGADIVVVSFPLYVDQLPAPLIQTLELVADRRKGVLGVTPWPGPAVQKLVAIVQCGFPEVEQNKSAESVMRRFAKEAGFEWAGALVMGMGGAIGRRPLDKEGGMLRNVVKALNRTAASLAAGGGVPEEASGLMAKPLMPRRLYFLAANWGFRRELKKNGAFRKAGDRPYA
jgi:hypothetical protein